jgi:hypothetical protein
MHEYGFYTRVRREVTGSKTKLSIRVYSFVALLERE